MLPPFFYTGRVSHVSAVENRPIFLIGMMGAGKSTVGRLLADRLGRRFVDTDQEVERVSGRSIAEIFAYEGEARFRALEAETIERVGRGNAVVALGGGAVTQPAVVACLRRRGPIVLLEAEVEVLLARIGDPQTRPLLADRSRSEQLAVLAGLAEDRAEAYGCADFGVDASGSESETVERILVGLERATSAPGEPRAAGGDR